MIAGTALVVDYRYVRWREKSLEPLCTEVDLTEAGTYHRNSSGYHSSRYYPGFRLDLGVPAGPSPDWGDGYSELWGSEAPMVRIVVTDKTGKVVLEEVSALVPTAGWIVTSSALEPEVEVYKFADFDATMFGSYLVELDVLRGSPKAASYSSRFFVSTIKAYALLGSGLFFLGLVVLVAVIGLVVLGVSVAHFMSKGLKKAGATRAAL